MPLLLNLIRCSRTNNPHPICCPMPVLVRTESVNHGRRSAEQRQPVQHQRCGTCHHHVVAHLW